MTGAMENILEWLLFLCPSYFLPSFIPSPLAKLRAHLLRGTANYGVERIWETDATYIPNRSQTARESITKSLLQLHCFFISCILL